MSKWLALFFTISTRIWAADVQVQSIGETAASIPAFLLDHSGFELPGEMVKPESEIPEIDFSVAVETLQIGSRVAGFKVAGEYNEALGCTAPVPVSPRMISINTRRVAPLPPNVQKIVNYFSNFRFETERVPYYRFEGCDLYIMDPEVDLVTESVLVIGAAFTFGARSRPTINTGHHRISGFSLDFSKTFQLNPNPGMDFGKPIQRIVDGMNWKLNKKDVGPFLKKSTAATALISSVLSSMTKARTYFSAEYLKKTGVKSNFPRLTESVPAELLSQELISARDKLERHRRQEVSWRKNLKMFRITR